MTTATTVTESYLLDEITTAVMWDMIRIVNYHMPNLYTMRPMPGRREQMAEYAGLTDWQVVAEGAASPEDKMEQQFTKQFVPVIFKKSSKFTRELLRDEGFGIAARTGADYGLTFTRTWEKRAAAVFNDAFAGATYTSADGLSLCNNSHVDKDGNNGVDNSLTNSLGLTGLKNTRQAGRDFTDYRGNVITHLMHSLLLVPNELEFDAVEISLSTERPDTASRATNQYSGIPVIVWDFLTDSNAWFMIDPAEMAQNLFWFIRDPLELWGTGDLNTGTRTIGGYARAVHGPLGWRWIIGNNPS